jgi:hypothetical protein
VWLQVRGGEVGRAAGVKCLKPAVASAAAAASLCCFLQTMLHRFHPHHPLQGDNFSNSTDSRHYGPVPYAMLRGRVFLKVGHA